MNILYLHQHFATRDGAGGTRSYEFARHLIRHGHTVTMVAAHRSGGGVDRTRRQTVDGIDLISLGGFYANHLGPWRRMWQFARFTLRASALRRLPRKPDIVIASSTPLSIGIPGAVLARRFGVPFVFEVRDLWPEAPIQLGFVRSKTLIWIARRLERWLYRRADAVIALSPGMADGVLAEGGDKQRLVTIPNASDIDLFDPKLADRDLLDRWGCTTKFAAVHAGSMGEANGLDYLLDAAAILKARGNDNVRMLIMGTGGTRERLERRAFDEGLDNVVFTGSIRRRDLGAVVSSADACIVSFADLPILATNSPNKLFDGLAAGLPIIVNSAGWTRDVIERSGAGRWVDVREPEQLADALVALAGDEQLRAQQGAAARRLAVDVFARERLATRFREVLEHVGGHEADRDGERDGERGDLPATLRASMLDEVART